MIYDHSCAPNDGGCTKRDVAFCKSTLMVTWRFNMPHLTLCYNDTFQLNVIIQYLTPKLCLDNSKNSTTYHDYFLHMNSKTLTARSNFSYYLACFISLILCTLPWMKYTLSDKIWDIIACAETRIDIKLQLTVCVAFVVNYNWATRCSKV